VSLQNGTKRKGSRNKREGNALIRWGWWSTSWGHGENKRGPTPIKRTRKKKTTQDHGDVGRGA